VQLIDIAKATGVAILLLVLNVSIAILVILVYSYLIDPGHPTEYYNQAALKIAPWCSHTAGTALFLVAGYLLTKWRPERNGYLFATTFTVLYIIIDAATVGFAGVLEMEFALSMLAKFVAALAGVVLAVWTMKKTDLDARGEK
jgi:hypothetical protein